jgi:hypothetical protein
MSDNFATSVRLSAEHHAFHSERWGRLRAVASTITTKAVKKQGATASPGTCAVDRARADELAGSE